MKKILSCFLMVLFVMVNTSTVMADTTKNKLTEIVVSNAEQFLKAIGSNKKIILKPGTYDLSSIKKVNASNGTVTWLDVYDGKELNVKNVENMVIEGEEKDKVHIITDARYANIIAFSKCTNITINNIVAGHKAQEYECDAGVLHFEQSDNIVINRSLLYGCGSMGVSVYEVSNFTFNDSIITDCSLRAAQISNSKYVRFNNSKFIKNRAYADIFSIYNSNIVIFDGCTIADNNNWQWNLISATNTSIVLLDNCVIENNSNVKAWEDDYGIFFGADNSNILVKDSKIKNNKYDALIDSYNLVYFDNCKFEDPEEETLGTTNAQEFWSTIEYNDDVYLEGTIERKKFEHPNGTKISRYVLKVDGVSYLSLGDSTVRKVKDELYIDVFSNNNAYDLNKLIGNGKKKVKIEGKAGYIGTAWYYSLGRVDIESLEIVK